MRVFIAITLPPYIKKRLRHITSTLQQSNVQAKWVDVSKLHITLQFLGDVDEEAIPVIAEAMQKVSSASPPFIVSLSKFGYFPQRDGTIKTSCNVSMLAIIKQFIYWGS